MISKLLFKCGLALCLGTLTFSAQARAQQYTQNLNVDCGNPAAQYSSIGAAVAAATDGAWIYVKPGTCTENVTIGYLRNIMLTTDWTQRVTLLGNLSIQSSHTVTVYGFNISNPAGNGVTIIQSTDVLLDSCSSSNNAGQGVGVSDQSHVMISNFFGTGTFSYNSGGGIGVGNESLLQMWAYEGQIDVSNNQGNGISVDRSMVTNLGNTTIMNNRVSSEPPIATNAPSGFGINVLGGGTVQLFGIFGPATIANNQTAGISMGETSQASIGGGFYWSPITIQGNGPYGIQVQSESQLTLFGKVQILDHQTAGVDLYGNSQGYITGANQITHNGYGAENGRAGIRVDGGSQASIRGAAISQNGGPGVLGLLNSSLDISGSTFTSNAGGAVACDSSAALATDLSSSVLGTTNACKVPSGAGMKRTPGSITAPSWQAAKARIDKMHSMIANIRH